MNWCARINGQSCTLNCRMNVLAKGIFYTFVLCRNGVTYGRMMENEQADGDGREMGVCRDA